LPWQRVVGAGGEIRSSATWRRNNACAFRWRACDSAAARGYGRPSARVPRVGVIVCCPCTGGVDGPSIATARRDGRRVEGVVYKVLAADYHPGQGKMGGATHARLRNLATARYGNTVSALSSSWRSAGGEAIDGLPLRRRDACYFMNRRATSKWPCRVPCLGSMPGFFGPSCGSPWSRRGTAHQRPVPTSWKPASPRPRPRSRAAGQHLEGGAPREWRRGDGPQFVKPGRYPAGRQNLKYVDRAKGGMK